MRALFIVVFLASCASTGNVCVSSADADGPVATACAMKAQAGASVLVDIAAKNKKPVGEITSEFLNACEGALQNDLDQTLTDLQAIANEDAGAH